MARATSALILATTLFLAVSVGGAGARQPAPPGGPTVTTAPVPAPRASIVVDAESGRVILASNEREALPPASTTKILTALLVRDRLALESVIGISQTASLAPPRRLSLTPGTRWRVDDLLYAMIHCSCNDAAWALGQAAGGGTMSGFEAESGRLAATLGLADGPVLRDPAGLDNPEQSVGGGNLISARDLAIAARAFLADGELAAIAEASGHDWVGGDDRPHSVTNLNRFLGAYEGAVGIKTGMTRRAGLTFVGAARRDGRTLIAVVLGSAAHYAHARELLDRAFLLGAAGRGSDDVLPAVPVGLGGGGPPTTTTTAAPTSTVPTSGAANSDAGGSNPAQADGDRTSALGRRSPSDDGVAVDPVWVGAGGAVVASGTGLAVLARRRARSRRGGVDRRPARPRRRDRPRTRPA